MVCKIWECLLWQSKLYRKHQVVGFRQVSSLWSWRFYPQIILTVIPTWFKFSITCTAPKQRKRVQRPSEQQCVKQREREKVTKSEGRPAGRLAPVSWTRVQQRPDLPGINTSHLLLIPPLSHNTPHAASPSRKLAQAHKGLGFFFLTVKSNEQEKYTALINKRKRMWFI